MAPRTRRRRLPARSNLEATDTTTGNTSLLHPSSDGVDEHGNVHVNGSTWQPDHVCFIVWYLLATTLDFNDIKYCFERTWPNRAIPVVDIKYVADHFENDLLDTPAYANVAGRPLMPDWQPCYHGFACEKAGMRKHVKKDAVQRKYKLQGKMAETLFGVPFAELLACPNEVHDMPENQNEQIPKTATNGADDLIKSIGSMLRPTVPQQLVNVILLIVQNVLACTMWLVAMNFYFVPIAEDSTGRDQLKPLIHSWYGVLLIVSSIKITTIFLVRRASSVYTACFKELAPAYHSHNVLMEFICTLIGFSIAFFICACSGCLDYLAKATHPGQIGEYNDYHDHWVNVVEFLKSKFYDVGID